MHWQDVAEEQEGLLSRAQLRTCGVDRFHERNQIAAGRWCRRSRTVVGTTTGKLTWEQSGWLGLLHGGPRALVGDLSAAEMAGLEGWHRDVITVWLPADDTVEEQLEGFRFVRTRRPLGPLRAPGSGVPRARIEPAVLHVAAHDRSTRTAQGVVAAAVQQRLTTPDLLLAWIDQLKPLRRAPLLRRVLGEIAGGAQSVAELDIGRICRELGLAPPSRQTHRRDASGGVRWTDCEWLLPNGHVLILKVDGSFHLEVGQWEADIGRQRTLTAADRVFVRCTARELRDFPEIVGADLVRLGVPRLP